LAAHPRPVCHLLPLGTFRSQFGARALPVRVHGERGAMRGNRPRTNCAADGGVQPRHLAILVPIVPRQLSGLFFWLHLAIPHSQSRRAGRRSARPPRTTATGGTTSEAEESS